MKTSFTRAAAAGALFLATSLGFHGCVTAANPSLAALSEGQFSLEKSHASLVFRVRHFGLSWYTMRFNEFDATLNFDPVAPESSSVNVIINPRSIDAYHPEKDADWDEELATSAKFLRAEEFPQITFNSTDVQVTGDNTGLVTGDLTLLGVTKPITMDVVFNGSNSLPWAPGRTMLGFSATGAFNRSDYGMTSLLPDIVSDEVRFQIEVEFQEDNSDA